ncbi:DUF1295-domain-containing protein [Polychaeton citri CBS 116435]|uniref:DUF1295-domain-containing protein n=1 Tax=Polychaeton citri CBS 116435 TaxID=1314669 RepID=A0A9P4UL76_9PEZI|nr:DUF1295-domain-containing protein [Polychaeton citri CBS 116435]
MPPSALSSLPIVTSIHDCAEYSKTFEPFLPQLYELPTHIWANIADPVALKQLYLTTNPAISGLAFSIALFPIFLVVSEINRNYSQVDRVWSILPTVYNIHYALWARFNGLPTQRLDNIMAFSVVWSIRLTYNYWRKGGYEIGSEDYRWLLIKKYIGGIPFFLLNIVFTSSLQSVLLWAVTTPTYILLLSGRVNPVMSFPDIIFARLLMGFIIFTWFADQQQWNYHQAKAEYQKTAKVPAGWTRAQMDRGFNTTGLWQYSRHPNFAAEQSIWITLYQWSCFETETFYNWAFVGALSYMLVFQGSTPITEWISRSKYPEYQLYQERVGKFVPKLIGEGWDEEKMEKMGPTLVQEKQKQK